MRAGVLGGFAVVAAVAGLLAPSAQARPNVLLIVMDDQRAGETMRAMPATKRAFFRKGISYPNAAVTTPLCCPSRASILTGRYAHNHGVFHNSQNSGELAQFNQSTTLPAHIGAAGYKTGLVGKYLNGWDIGRAPPHFDHYAVHEGNYFNSRWNLNGNVRVIDEYATRYVADRANRFIGAQEGRDRKPWFLMMAPFAPHATFDFGPGGCGVCYQPERKYRSRDFGPFETNPARAEPNRPGGLADKPPFWRQLVDVAPPSVTGLPTARQSRNAQLRLLLSADDAIERVLTKLRRTNEDRKTLAIFTSDNGLLWGEHGDVPVKDMPWSPAADVPLAMRWPGHFDGGERDRRIAANIDLMPTILKVAGVPVPGTVDGMSLLGSQKRTDLLLEYGGLELEPPLPDVPRWSSLYAPGTLQYTEYTSLNGGAATFREYYNLAADPLQVNNPLDNGPVGDGPPLATLAALSARLAAARICDGPIACP